jgi:hypothetical protein
VFVCCVVEIFAVLGWHGCIIWFVTASLKAGLFGYGVLVGVQHLIIMSTSGRRPLRYYVQLG